MSAPSQTRRAAGHHQLPSLEDRIVKQWMAHEGRTWNDEPLNPYGGTPHTPSLQIITRKP
jgi:16S rRNA C1402 N4-methylase RsmH